MKLIFALGNPGERYKYTYHSLGLLLADEFLKNTSIQLEKEGPTYTLYKSNGNLVLKSKVYMNVSYEALKNVYTFFKLTPKDILVLHDELSLKKYEFKLKVTEGLGGHNGLRDIAKHIGSSFARLRIGIDHPKNFNSHLDVSDYVLSQLKFEEWKQHFYKGEEEIKKWLETK